MAIEKLHQKKKQPNPKYKKLMSSLREWEFHLILRIISINFAILSSVLLPRLKKKKKAKI